MATDRMLEWLAELYQNECFGDLFVDAIISGFPDPAVRRILGTIAQFETETKARLRPAMMEFGLKTLPTEETFENARDRAAEICRLPWREVLSAAQTNLRERVVPRFQEIAELAAAEGDALAIEVAEYMVIHEKALLQLLDRALAGEASPERGVQAMLHFPLPKSFRFDRLSRR